MVWGALFQDPQRADRASAQAGPALTLGLFFDACAELGLAPDAVLGGDRESPALPPLTQPLADGLLRLLLPASVRPERVIATVTIEARMALAAALLSSFVEALAAELARAAALKAEAWAQAGFAEPKPTPGTPARTWRVSLTALGPEGERAMMGMPLSDALAFAEGRRIDHLLAEAERDARDAENAERASMGLAPK